MLKVKKEKRSKSYYEVISTCLQALDEVTRKGFYRKLNNTLIKELDVDYSSFFLNAGENLLLYETNIRSDVVKQGIETIHQYMDPDGDDFKGAFERKEIIFMESSNVLLYPTAKHRHIRSAMCLPLAKVGYWLIEDSRLIGSDERLQAMAKLSIELERLLRVHGKLYMNESLNIPTAKAVTEECYEVARSISLLRVDNLDMISEQHGPEVRNQLLEITVHDLEKEQVLRGGIGIRNDDTIFIFSMLSIDKSKELLDQVVKRIEGYRLTIEGSTEQLNVRVETGTLGELEKGELESRLRRSQHEV